MKKHYQAILATCLFGLLCIMYTTIYKNNRLVLTSRYEERPSSRLPSSAISKAGSSAATKLAKTSVLSSKLPNSITKEPKLTKTTARVNQNTSKADHDISCHNITSRFGLCHPDEQSHQPHCLMSINLIGRLGNSMGQYATLFALSQLNKRPAFMLPEMAAVLLPYFHVTLPTLHKKATACLKSNWTYRDLHDWMEDGYKTLETDSTRPIMLTGYPCSWTFFHHIAEQIRNEFRLRSPIQKTAQETLQSLRGNRSTVTFIGVHARRTDYVYLMAGQYRGVVADGRFFVLAMDYFRSRYPDALFVVASDDMEWCRNHIDSSLGDVYFAGVGRVDDPIHDLALLSQCNHSIITIGTYGFWAAYLAGGETVHLTNYTLPDSPLLKVLRYNTSYLPSWLPIAADLSVLGS